MWVLTGDKEETAINIAVACNLVLPTEYMEQVIVNKNTAPDIDKAKAVFQYETKVCVAILCFYPEFEVHTRELTSVFYSILF